MVKCIKKISLLLFCMILIFQLIFIPNTVQANTYTQSVQLGIDKFPETYQEKLRKLQETYPNWTFTAYNTGITWNEFIDSECSVHTRNVVISSNPLWLDSCGQSVKGGYKCASRTILEYYSDPRNFLNESGIFQFLEMTYNSSSQTEDGVKNIIQNTFMNKETTFQLNGVETTMHFSRIIMDAAVASRMSPYSIAIKIRQEVGVKGSSSVSGHYVSPVNGLTYDGYYNFFNYGASDTNDPITNGLEYAKQHNWTNPYIAIVEGAETMANNYTNAGQNTAYFYKWDVVGNETSQLFSHQYMTNIEDPSSQAKSLFNTYVTNNLLSTPLNFVIPVFEGMPNVNNLPSTIDENLPTSYYINGTGVRLRATPSTSASIVSTLSKNEVVTLLEWCSANVDGLEWARIQLSNGTVGYVANKYLVSCNGSSMQNVKIDGDYVKATPGTTVEKIAELLKSTNYEVYSGQTKLQGTSNLATGYILKDISNNKQYIVIVLGDANGDGKLTPADSTVILRAYVGLRQLNVVETLSADVNGDGKTTPADSTVVLRAYVGLTSIKL